MMHNSEASENWDDDFEFHSNRTATRPPEHEIRAHLLQHGEHDNDNNNHAYDTQQDINHERPARHRDSHETTENWDDDFAEDEEEGDDADADAEEEVSSPASGDAPASLLRDPETNAAASTSAFPPPTARATQRTPRASKIQQRMRAGSGSTARQGQGGGWGDSSDEDDDEFGRGFEEDGEDRTVTARSRRNLVYTLNSSPPPPVPPLPGGITPASSIGRGAGLGMGINIPDAGGIGGLQPFPRSPTASVFSAPDSASIAYTHTSAGSTTALTRPTHPQHKALAKGLAGLPPSPPIHRERRRLRKKSRPSGSGGGGGGGVEMRDLPRRGVVRESSEEATGEEEEDWDAEDGIGAGGGASAIYGPGAGAGAGSSSSAAYAYPNHHTPYTNNANNNSRHSTNVYPHAHPNGSSTSARTPYAGTSANGSQSHVALGSPGPGLLARIGSVKRWGFGDKGEKAERARRKKSSSVSVGSELGEPDLDVIHDISEHIANEATPRPPSQANSLLGSQHSSESPSQRSRGSRSGSGSREGSAQARHSYAHPAPATPPSKGHRHSQYTPKTPPQTPPERGWFFRGVSGEREQQQQQPQRGTRFRGGSGSGAGGGVGRDGAAGQGGAADLSGERPYTPTPHGGEREGKEKDGKTKLVKRRSLGFVQIRRAIRPLNGGAEGEDDNATPLANPQATNPTPNASPSKYGVLGVGRPSGAGVGSVEDLGRHKDKEREGMGFVERNVRRISLVGQRHKRTKSGVSITALGVSGDEKENDSKGKRAGSEKRSIDGLPPLPPPTPPVDVQVQSPSPPQTLRSTSASTATMKASAPINIGPSRKLEVHPSAFSPTFSSSPGSISLASPISLASSSTPSLMPYSAASSPPSHSHSHSTSPSPKPPVSPQSASLGRSAAAHPVVTAAAGAASSPLGASGTGTMRRNSLGDLKIPARISQAQVGLRRDLGMVREFARNVEELKDLQGTYQTLVLEVQGILDMHVLHPTQSREKAEKEPTRTSPTFFKRHRSNTSTSGSSPTVQQQTQQQAYKQLTSAFYTINSKYRISWECAELLIELGGGGSSSPPSTSTSAPAMQQSAVGGSDGLKGGKKSKRERAITLQDDAKTPPAPAPVTVTASLGTVPSPPLASPPSNLAWRASTGRNDLSTRQLLLLKEMLNPTPGGPDESFVEDIPEEMVAAMAAGSTATVNREWRWGDAMNSTVTLPSEESGTQGGVPGKEKKRRSSRMRMSGIRDMLRALTKGGATPPVPVSSTSVSTASSSDLHAQHLYQHRQVATNGKQQQRRRAKTSAGPESVSIRSTHRPLSPFDPPSLKTASPRRPSLASIFRIGKTKSPPTSAVADLSFDSAQDGFDHEVYPTFSGVSGGRGSASTSTGDEEEDWDRLEDSASDAEAAAAVARRGGSTIRGRSPYMQTSLLSPASGRPTTPMRSPSGSRTSVHDLSAAAPARATRLSNVEEHADTKSTSKAESPSRQFSRSRRGGKTGSVRSMPPATLPDPKLAMTPENIKPLLENAREVHARLSDCIAEIRALLAARP